MTGSKGDVMSTVQSRSDLRFLKKSRVVYETCRPLLFVLYCLAMLGTSTTKRVVAELLPKGTLNNTTYLLDTLLSEDNYDRQIRPGFGGPPTVISTDIEIRSFGPVSESEMMFSMDCYFRQTWVDARLKFHNAKNVLSMDWKFLQKVWIPDTFFLNGKSSYLHKVTVPNKFIRLREDGQLKYSMRLTIKASCPMHLRKYPLDTQACPLEIGSFAYPANEVQYNWSGAVQLSKDVVLSQYDLINTSITKYTHKKPRGDQRSTLIVRFVIRRRRGYFILQIYAPCAMIVGASWVSFWINMSDAAGRVAVGATTVLTMVTMGFGGRGSLQRVAYATALDWFVIMCFTFVFAALVEYAFVNFIDNYEKQQLKIQMELDKEKKQKEEALENITERVEPAQPPQTSTGFASVRFKIEERATDKDNHVAPLSAEDQLRQQQLQLQQLMQGQRLSLRRRPFTARRKEMEQSGYKSKHIASKVDSYARVVFPVTFAVLNIMYWTLFLHIMDDEISLGAEFEDSAA